MGVNYVQFLQTHPLFLQGIYLQPVKNKPIMKINQKTKPTLQERGLTTKDILQKAQRAKNDEFYTRIEDVEKEFSMYEPSLWKDKTVFCNCDDAVDEDTRRTSAFTLYFMQNFQKLELKKLICTHYSGTIDLFQQGTKGYIFIKDRFQEMKDYPPNYTGSFDHPLSLEILTEEADIVCTNPPFSKAIDYWKTIVPSGKLFLILSNIALVLTTSYLHYFKNRKVWAGYHRVDHYLNPKKELVDAAGHWYTNIPLTERPKYQHLKIIPLEQIPSIYKKIDDRHVLLVDHCYIPSDYEEPFAVSVRPILNGLLEKGYAILREKEYYPYVKRKKCFARVLVHKIGN